MVLTQQILSNINSHSFSAFLLSCFETEVWKAKTDLSQNPLKLGILLAISSQWNVGKSCWQSLPAKFLQGSDSTSPAFKLQFFSPLPDWYNGCRGGSHIVIRSKHRAGRAGRRSLDPGWHGGAFVLAACPSGPTMWDQIPPSPDQHGSVGWASPP